MCWFGNCRLHRGIGLWCCWKQCRWRVAWLHNSGVEWSVRRATRSCKLAPGFLRKTSSTPFPFNSPREPKLTGWPASPPFNFPKPNLPTRGDGKLQVLVVLLPRGPPKTLALESSPCFACKTLGSDDASAESLHALLPQGGCSDIACLEELIGQSPARPRPARDHVSNFPGSNLRQGLVASANLPTLACFCLLLWRIPMHSRLREKELVPV